MIDEEEAEVTYPGKDILKELLERPKESLANELYNALLVTEEITEEGIPYMGLFWRDCDFVNKEIHIGIDTEGKIGIMENNKWGYPEREMTEIEVDKFIELINRLLAVDHGFRDDITFYRNRRLDELRKWVQGLNI
jgi:hypothetical protein